MATPKGHDRTVKQTEDDDDPVDKMLRETGCIDHHHKLQYCMADHGDWRKCKDDLNTFKACMVDYVKRKNLTAKVDPAKS